VKADLGIHQRLLCRSDAGSDQLSLNGGATFDQPKGDRAELKVPRGATDEADGTPIELELGAGSWQRIDASVEV
jgi:hypothetical protein